MKINKYIVLTVLSIVVVWIFDAIIDYFIFFDDNFFDLLILNVSHHEIYTRILFSFFIIVISFIYYKFIRNVHKINFELIKSNRELQITLNSIGDAVIVTDASKRIIIMNPIAEKLTGWKFKDAEGKELSQVFEIVNSLTREKVEDPAEKVLRLGRIVGLANHTTLIAKDGTEYQIADSGSPIIDDEGKLIGVILVFRDVSLLYQKEQELKNYGFFLEAIFNSIQDGISVLNPDLTIRMTNDVMKEWYRQNFPLEGKKCFQCYHNRREACDPCPSIRALRSKRTEFNIVPGLPGSKTEWLELYSYPILDEYNNVTGIVEFVRDVTERVNLNRALKESEANYKEMIESLPLGFYRTSLDGEILYANKKLCELLGYKDLEEFKKSGNITNTYANGNRREYFKREFNIKNYLEHFEIEIKKKDGQKIIVNDNARAIRNKEGEIDYFEGTIEDITWRKKFEKEMLLFSKMESISILSGGIAHNFNNLLTSMSLNVGLAKLNPDKYLEYLNRLEREIDEASSLSNKFLSFTKSATISRKPVNFKTLIDDIEKMALTGSGCITKKFIDEDIWNIYVDSKQIDEVFMNLLINAKQAMANEGVIIITASNFEAKNNIFGLKDGKYLRITVKDEGIGIPEKYLDKIFDPFFTTKEQGSGLGLSSSLYIIQKHNGKISVTSELGKGTTFELYLPATEKEVEIPKKKVDVSKMENELKILFMDDEQNIRENIEEICEILNFQVDTVKNGEEAIEKYKESIKNNAKYNIVILDLTVKGGLGGDKAIKELLKIDPDIKAIVFSGHSTIPIIANYESYGFKGRMFKPTTIDGFLEVIKQVMENN